MTNLVTKVFEGNSIRTVDLGNGNFSIVASDVAEALGYRDANKLTRMLDEDEKDTHLVGTLGGDQHMACITESGLYHAIFSSKRESAKRFRRFVTEEILPEIRKTGSYQPKSQSNSVVADLFLIGQALERIGVAKDIAMACTLKSIELNTGLNLATERKALPGTTKELASMNATALGRHIGLRPSDTNDLLYEKGLQKFNGRGKWELTDEGKKYAEAFPFTRNGHSDYQILWKLTVLPIINK